MVEYIDGSIIAQMGTTDMRLPIQYALTFPKRMESEVSNLNLIGKNLSFEEVNKDVFKAVSLAYKALGIGGTMPAVLNASNEAAVELFLNKKISFLQIVDLVQKCMEKIKLLKNPSLEEILEIDKISRDMAYNLSKSYIN
jgi:1-deoxy-D-xylulose-5-phosphate reductoisomerase